MLVLGRREGEEIVIDGPCTIRVTKIMGGVVKIGVEAAREVKVLRAELLRTPNPAEFPGEHKPLTPGPSPRSTGARGDTAEVADAA